MGCDLTQPFVSVRCCLAWGTGQTSGCVLFTTSWGWSHQPVKPKVPQSCCGLAARSSSLRCFWQKHFRKWGACHSGLYQWRLICSKGDRRYWSPTMPGLRSWVPWQGGGLAALTSRTQGGLPSRSCAWAEEESALSLRGKGSLGEGWKEHGETGSYCD